MIDFHAFVPTTPILCYYALNTRLRARDKGVFEDPTVWLLGQTCQQISVMKQDDPWEVCQVTFRIQGYSPDKAGVSTWDRNLSHIPVSLMLNCVTKVSGSFGHRAWSSLASLWVWGEEGASRRVWGQVLAGWGHPVGASQVPEHPATQSTSLPRGYILRTLWIISLSSIFPNDLYFCSSEENCEEVWWGAGWLSRQRKKTLLTYHSLPWFSHYCRPQSHPSLTWKLLAMPSSARKTFLNHVICLYLESALLSCWMELTYYLFKYFWFWRGDFFEMGWNFPFI